MADSPSIKVTSSKSIVEAAMDPTVTVTIQSKLFICDVERFPDNRMNTIIEKYVMGTEMRMPGRSSS